jgi:hypothetical protein
VRLSLLPCFAVTLLALACTDATAPADTAAPRFEYSVSATTTATFKGTRAVFTAPALGASGLYIGLGDSLNFFQFQAAHTQFAEPGTYPIDRMTGSGERTVTASVYHHITEGTHASQSESTLTLERVTPDSITGYFTLVLREDQSEALVATLRGTFAAVPDSGL